MDDLKCWTWTCWECESCGVEFTEGAAETMLAAHLCLPPPKYRDALTGMM